MEWFGLEGILKTILNYHLKTKKHLKTPLPHKGAPSTRDGSIAFEIKSNFFLRIFDNLISFILFGFDLDVWFEWILGNYNSMTGCFGDSFSSCWLHLLFT